MRLLAAQWEPLGAITRRKRRRSIVRVMSALPSAAAGS